MPDIPSLPVGWHKPTQKDLTGLMPRVKVLHLTDLESKPYWATARLLSIDPVTVRLDNGSILSVSKLESLAIAGAGTGESEQRRHG